MQDHELLEKFQQADSKNYAFNLLVRKYQERVYWHIRKMVLVHEDADDLVQDVFVKVWKNLHKFNQDASLFTWIYRIATNECLTFLNKKKRKLFSSAGSEINEELVDNLVASNELSGDEIEIKLQKALTTLPEKQRLVFHMKYFDDMKYNEISEVLDTSVGGLKASYHHAVKKIETYLTDN
ncbi:MAG: RNA polymerase sigma factor [Cyclobacteriaceae bacterium]